jgi:transposase InsO family protein
MNARRAKELRRRTAELRFSIVGPLLASPPPRGQLWPAIEALAEQRWRHPEDGRWVRFGASSIERWYYAARRSADPLRVLSRKVRMDAGSERVMTPKLLGALAAQYKAHPGWSYKLHADNLAVLAAEEPETYGDPASYSTVRRRMVRRGWFRKRRPRHPTPGQQRAFERLERLEVRSFEADHVHALWHLDFHHARRRVADAHGRWHTPLAMAVLDDRSRLCCHMQWYLAENAENLVHGLCQAFAKRGLPRGLVEDNGSAMRAAETINGLTDLGVTPQFTLPHSPYMNGKQECFWGSVEGRLMALLENVEPLTMELLNRTTQAWVEVEYNQSRHSETAMSPLARLLEGPDVSRAAPGSERLRQVFTVQVWRRQRRSDGTITLDGVRFELPSRLRTLVDVQIRYRRWDLSVAWVVDPRTGDVIARIRPIDKSTNADGRRRTLEPLDADVEAPAPTTGDEPIPALMRKILSDYAATGLPPAYLPKDETTTSEDPDDH